MRPSCFRASVVFIGLLLLVACAQPQLAPASAPAEQRVPAQQPPARPDIPRVDLPPELPYRGTEERASSGLEGPQEAGRDWALDWGAATQARGVVVGDAQHPFLFGMKIGDFVPVLTRAELAMLATPPPVAYGRALHHESLIRFDFGEDTSGELRFVRDPRTGVVGSELFFAEDAPIVEYAYLLYEGSFPILLGEPLSFFGHRYRVTDVSNTTLELTGIDTEHALLLVNGSRLAVDGKRYPHTFVTVDPWSVTIRYTADDVERDGIHIRPGTSLRAQLRSPIILLNEDFDISYEGLATPRAGTIRFVAGGDNVRLVYTDLAGARRELIIAALRDGELGFGDEDTILRTAECAQPCIHEDESFLITGPDGTSQRFTYDSVRSDELRLRDAHGEVHIIELEDAPGYLDGAASFGGRLYRVKVDPVTHALALDLNGDGVLADTQTLILAQDGYEIQFPAEQPLHERLIDVVSPPLNGLRSEGVTVRLAQRDGELLVGLGQGPELERSEDSRFWVGTTPRGLIVTLEDSGNGLLGDELTIKAPLGFSEGVVRISG